MILPRLLSIVAMIGFMTTLAMTPPAWAVNAAPVAIHASDMADTASMPGMGSVKGPMECCPQDRPVTPSCPKDCPWAALCAAQCLSDTAGSAAHGLMASLRTNPIMPVDDRSRDGMGEAPPPRPPRT